MKRSLFGLSQAKRKGHHVLSQLFDWLYLPHFLLLKWVVVKYSGVPLGRGGGAVGSVGVLRARCCHLRAGFQQCKSFVEMGTVRCCPLSGAEDCITSTRRLWRSPLVSHPRCRGFEPAAATGNRYANGNCYVVKSRAPIVAV